MEHPGFGKASKKIFTIGISPPQGIPKSKVRDRTILRLLSKSKPKNTPLIQEKELFLSLESISRASQSIVLGCGSPNPSGTIQSLWALSISKKEDVKEKFDNLRKAVEDYNTTASKGQLDLIQKQGSNIEELRKLAENCQAAPAPGMEGHARSKIKDGMQQFCKTTLHYAEVMDVLIEHHPEWVSLAWGTIKLFLMIPIEYQKIQESVTTNLARIGDRLQLVALLLRFFPSEKMVDASSTIYSSIAEFLEISLRWLRNNWLVRTLKAVAVPFETRLGPILEKIDENYGILKEYAEMQWLISDFEQHLQTQSELSTLGKSMDRVLEILEDFVKQDQFRRERESKAIQASKALDRSLFHSPTLDICKEFFPELLPIEQNLQRAQALMDLIPITQISESINMVHRKEFRVWMETEASGLLWIDGYQVPHRPSWTTGFALNVIRAAMVNGHDTLYYFGSLHQDILQPRALVQSLLFHLLQRFPTILSHGDPELFSAEIFLTAKSSLDLSWRIFLECLRLLPSTVVYLIVEGIDHVQMSNVGNDFQNLLTQLKSLSTAGVLDEKLVKVLLTSVRPNAGFDILFPSHEMPVNEVDNNVLIRVPRAVSRSRRGIWRSEDGSSRSPNSQANALQNDGADEPDSGSSFDIFDTQAQSGKTKLSRSQSSDFAPSESDVL
ncbi:hypothetical protein T069G_02037 [Trichoderma breve]|uniref:Uncharacterized protein n=1 Tax=Trichoderma breve TaxID=2034170 RepID=A0A9W9EF97_9HYPO|nr:hypothetical protein T069G_02037 [Trichoderma breve]KAJ4865507.1 hypothetical protein T069G_02037 [Trichoderma breve]